MKPTSGHGDGRKVLLVSKRVWCFQSSLVLITDKAGSVLSLIVIPLGGGVLQISKKVNHSLLEGEGSIQNG